MKHLSKTTDMAAIRAYYRNEVDDLTQHQQAVRDRLLQVQSLMLKGKPTFEIISVLTKDYNVSESQAYRDLRNATTLYGDLRKAEKEGIRRYLYDMFLEDYLAARADGDRKAMGTFQKNLISVSGVDREDPDTVDMSKIEVPPVIMIFGKEMEGKIADSQENGVLDLTEFFGKKNTIEDAIIDTSEARTEGEDTGATLAE